MYRPAKLSFEKPLSETLVSFLYAITEIVKNNKVFISCSHKDRIISDILTHYLEKCGYDVIRYNTFSIEESEKHEKDILILNCRKQVIWLIAKNGIFLPIITNNYINSVYCMSEIEKILYFAKNNDVIFKPVYTDILQSVVEMNIPVTASRYGMYNLGNVECLSSDDIKGLMHFIETDNLIWCD